MIGMKFGRLTVVDHAERSKGGMRRVLCQCECGNSKVVRYDSLVRGDSQSCGCLRNELVSQRFRTHGFKNTKIYTVWYSMHQRCRDDASPAWHGYGGRGIKVCDRWQSFMNFYSDMGDVPFKGAQLDRIDNNGGYSPDNCRWTDRKTNSRNKRNNRMIEFDGQIKSMAEWCELLGLSYPAIKARFQHGWDATTALTTPVGKSNGRIKGEFT